MPRQATHSERLLNYRSAYGSPVAVSVLLDTNAYVAFMQGAAEVVEVVAHADKLYLNSIVLGELLGGFAAGTREPKNRAELARFLDSPRVTTLAITTQTADSCALVYAGLRCGTRLHDFLP